MRKKIIIILVLLPTLLMAQTEKKQDAWGSMKLFVGMWQGEGEGKSGVSKVWKEWRFVLNGKFLQMKTRAVFSPQKKNPEGEVHEDEGYFSLDRARRQIVFRQFHVEGFIIQYVLENISEDRKRLIFVAEQIENGPPGLQAKLTFRILDVDTIEERFELSFPGKEFDCYNINTIKRKK